MMECPGPRGGSVDGRSRQILGMPRMSHKILILTKDKTVATLLSEGLEKRGLVVSTTHNAKKMLDRASAGRADFVLVDGSGSPEHGLECCRKLRQIDQHARIILAMPKPYRIQNGEADACLVAPITLRKVYLRIVLLLRDDARDHISVSGFTLDIRDRSVRWKEREIKLTPKETRLLQLLMERAGTVVPRSEIMKHVWDTEYLGDTRTVDVHIRWLRKKLEPRPDHPMMIRTFRRCGYLFDVPAEEPEIIIVDERQTT